MKKSIILFSVACAAYGATLLALGIYMLQFDLSASIVETLVEKASIFGLALVIMLYIPILLIGYACYFFIIFGAGYVIFFARTLYSLHKNDLPWLLKSLRALHISHCCLAVLLLLADIIILPYIFSNIQSGVPAALIIFTVLINVTAICLETANIFALKKLKQNIMA